jgi:hypothetical protein
MKDLSLAFNLRENNFKFQKLNREMKQMILFLGNQNEVIYWFSFGAGKKKV